MARTAAAAEDSFAAILARSRFGMAMAAMIRMIATTMSSSISEKPFCCRIVQPHAHLLQLTHHPSPACVVTNGDYFWGWSVLWNALQNKRASDVAIRCS